MGAVAVAQFATGELLLLIGGPYEMANRVLLVAVEMLAGVFGMACIALAEVKMSKLAELVLV